MINQLNFNFSVDPLNVEIESKGICDWKKEKSFPELGLWIFTCSKGSIIFMIEKQVGKWFVTSKISWNGMVQTNHNVVYVNNPNNVRTYLNYHVEWFQNAFHKIL